MAIAIANKMHIKLNKTGGVVGAIPYESMGCYSYIL